MIQKTYRNFFKGEFDPQSHEIEAKLWQGVFRDIPAQEVYAAFGSWASQQEFPPVPASLNKLIKKNRNPEAFISPEQAWDTVIRAVRNFGWCNELRAMQTLSEPVKRAIRNVGGWQKVCQTPDGREWDYLRKNFMESFTEFSSETKSHTLIPENVWNRLKDIRQKQLSNGTE
jgi:hypothetical protein